jgi:hypothetical protein
VAVLALGRLYTQKPVSNRSNILLIPDCFNSTILGSIPLEDLPSPIRAAVVYQHNLMTIDILQLGRLDRSANKLPTVIYRYDCADPHAACAQIFRESNQAKGATNAKKDKETVLAISTPAMPMLLKPQR